MKSKEKKQLI